MYRCPTRDGVSRYRYERLVRDKKNEGKEYPYTSVRRWLGPNAERALLKGRELDREFDAVEAGESPKPDLKLADAIGQYIVWLRDVKQRIGWKEPERNLGRLLGFLGNVALRSISRGDIKRFHTAEAARSANATANSALRDAKRLLFWALDAEQVDRNPAERIRPLPVPRRAWQLPSSAQVQALLHGADPVTRRLIIVLASTAARLGEALALDWSRVDFVQGTVTLVQSKTGDNELVIPMSRRLKDELMADWLNVGGPTRGPVFPGHGAGGQRAGEACAREFKKLATRLEMPWMTLKRFRNLALTEVWRKTGDVRLAQKLAGHTTSRITEQYYVRADEEARKRAVNALEGFLDLEVDTKVDIALLEDKGEPALVAGKTNNL